MGLLHLNEDRPTPPSVYNWRVYLLAVIASCGSNMIGYTSAFIGTTVTLASFKDVSTIFLGTWLRSTLMVS